ncbi:MAG: hypothetical protein ABJE95_33585 [Byssovorax sp.]
MRRALVASAGSIAFHGSVVAVAVLVAALKREPETAAIEAPAHAIDVMSGVTSAIGGERLVDVNVDALGGQVGPAGAAGHAVSPTPPAAPPPSPPAKAANPVAIAPKPAAVKPAAVDPAASSTVDETGEGNEKPAPPAAPPRVAKRKAGGGASGENGDGARLGPFGAEGPSAVRSLGRAFTHSIAVACQSDAGWAKLPVGEAGAIEVALSVDESGRVTGFRSLDRDPPKQLLALVKRTIALIDSGTFELKGSIGAGVEVLRIQASVSDLTADVAGGMVALSNGDGKAAFTQEGGRHVEVTLRVLKIETQTPAATP